jgi:L-alanine-DL-glutamate epimerase-like enolase superfamily enzyme
MPASIQRVTGIKVYFIPVKTRLPLKFGTETLNSVTCCRVALTIVDQQNRRAEGWGETPLSVQWVWPSPTPYEQRHRTLRDFCCALASAWLEAPVAGHALEAGFDFQESTLREAFERFNQNRVHDQTETGSAPVVTATDSMPWLAALVCNSAFDIALHDAFGKLVDLPIYETYSAAILRRDLARFLEPADDCHISFAGQFPADYLVGNPAQKLTAWHLVGGLDPLDGKDLAGTEPLHDGHPVLLDDWIRRDGLKCLKVKLRGNDEDWDCQRLIRVSRVGLPLGVEWLSADFNCTVHDPDYVIQVLNRFKSGLPAGYEKLLYVEQPFPYELERYRIDVRSVAARKPLFLDESAHDWRMVRLGRDLGWTGVALKTCKTQTGAILSACWAKAHGMDLMVQDLTNPMLAQIPHLLLAAHVGTIMGVETNSMQFYPEASAPEAKIHPGLYQRREGMVDLATVRGPGFGYRLDEVERILPAPAVAF